MGIYEADGGLFGELRYAARHVTGKSHCSLCDITHQGIKPKADWKAMCADIPVPFDLVHLNERTQSLLDASDGQTPCVFAEVGDELILVFTREDLEACAGEVSRFSERLYSALAEKGIALH